MIFSPFGVALALTKVAISCYVAVLNSAALQQDKNPFPVQFSCLKVSWAAASLVYMLVKDALLASDSRFSTEQCSKPLLVDDINQPVFH